MASLKALKLRIGTVKSTQKITKAMKMVAAAKLRRAQSNAEQGRPYSQRLSDVVRYEAALLSYLRSDRPEILAKIRDTKALDDDTAKALKDALAEFGKTFA